MEKVIRDGRVAVLISRGFGAGWSTWNPEHPQCAFDPEVVAWVESDRAGEFPDIKAKYDSYFYTGGADDLVIEWVPVGSRFQITEYDGSEDLVLESDMEWLVA